jgi:restriction endonuclease Mrr
MNGRRARQLRRRALVEDTTVRQLVLADRVRRHTVRVRKPAAVQMPKHGKVRMTKSGMVLMPRKLKHTLTIWKARHAR